MIRYLKKGMSAVQAATEDAKVRGVVEEMLGAISARGDAAVREYSARLDKWSPPHFRLSRSEIEACYRELPGQAVLVPGLGHSLMRWLLRKPASILAPVHPSGMNVTAIWLLSTASPSALRI